MDGPHARSDAPRRSPARWPRRAREAVRRDRARARRRRGRDAAAARVRGRHQRGPPRRRRASRWSCTRLELRGPHRGLRPRRRASRRRRASARSTSPAASACSWSAGSPTAGASRPTTARPSGSSCGATDARGALASPGRARTAPTSWKVTEVADLRGDRLLVRPRRAGHRHRAGAGRDARPPAPSRPPGRARSRRGHVHGLDRADDADGRAHRRRSATAGRSPCAARRPPSGACSTSPVWAASWASSVRPRWRATPSPSSRRSASTRSRRSSSCSRASRPTRPADDFYSRLCEATCRLADMDRAVIFRYDGARRRVRAAGAYGIPLEVFADAQVTVETVQVARDSLVEDRVIEISSAMAEGVPDEFRDLIRESHARVHADGRRRPLARRDPVRPRAATARRCATPSATCCGRSARPPRWPPSPAWPPTSRPRPASCRSAWTSRARCTSP